MELSLEHTVCLCVIELKQEEHSYFRKLIAQSTGLKQDQTQPCWSTVLKTEQQQQQKKQNKTLNNDKVYTLRFSTQCFWSIEI